MIDIPHAQLRGRYMAAVAVEEWNGIPIDVELFTRIRDRREQIQLGLIATWIPHMMFMKGLHSATGNSSGGLIEHGIPWPRGQGD